MAVGLPVLLQEVFTLLLGGVGRKHSGHDASVDKLPAQFLAVLDGGTKHNGLAVVTKALPVGHHVTHDLEFALFCGFVCPLTPGGLRTRHVRLGTREDSHGHQHAVLCQVVHGGGVDQVREYLAQPHSEGRGRQTNHSGLGVHRKLSPSLVGGVGLIDHQHVHCWPEVALANGLHRGNLKQFIRATTPMFGLDDTVIEQAVSVSHLRGLVNQRGAIAQEHCALALLHGLVADAQTKVGLPSPGGGHDDLVLVAITKPLAKGIVGCQLKLAGCWESIITLTWR